MRLILLLLLFSFSTFSQSTEELKAYRLDSLKKHHLIFISSYDARTPTHISRKAKLSSSTSARSIIIGFRVGSEGSLVNIGRKGSSLLEAIKNDPDAYAELTRAFKVHMKKKRLCNTLKVLGFGVSLVSAVPLIIGLENFETRGLTNLAMIGGVGVTLGLTDFLVYRKLTEKHRDAFAVSVQRAIYMYNQNLLHKIK